jgi:protein TonB
MERPSHIIFDTKSHHFSQRLPFITLAISLQAGALWLFMHAFVPQVFHLPPGDIRVRWIPEEPLTHLPPPPPPPRISNRIDVPPIPPLQPWTTDSGPRTTITTTSIAPTQQPSVSAGANRAPISLTATHTVPPYPPIARRIGAEGKVTLQLTVTPEGRVSEAEVVTSSGRGDLDQTAQAWIVAHWTYKPALANGVPVISKTLASVTFSLINGQ